MNDRYSHFVVGGLIAGNLAMPLAQGIICDNKPIDFSNLRIISQRHEECHVSHAPHDHREIHVSDSTDSTTAYLRGAVSGTASVIGGYASNFRT